MKRSALPLVLGVYGLVRICLSPRCLRSLSARSALKLEMFRRCFSFVRDFLVFDNLPFIEAAEASFLDERESGGGDRLQLFIILELHLVQGLNE